MHRHLFKPALALLALTACGEGAQKGSGDTRDVVAEGGSEGAAEAVPAEGGGEGAAQDGSMGNAVNEAEAVPAEGGGEGH